MVVYFELNEFQGNCFNEVYSGGSALFILLNLVGVVYTLDTGGLPIISTVSFNS